MFSGSTNLTWSVYLKLAVFDSGGLSREESFSFTLENVNEFPTAIDTVYYNERTSPNGAEVYLTRVSDNDPDNFSSYASNNYFLPTDIGDNALFDIRSNFDNFYVKNDSTLNYEMDSIYNLTVGVLGDYPDTMFLPLIVKIQNQNDPITGLGLSADSVAENMPAGTAIGAVLWEDEDVDAGYDITVVQNNNTFEVVNDTLYTLVSLDFETNQSISTRLSFDDTVSNSNTRFQYFTIQVLDRNDPPRFTGNATNTFNENDTTASVRLSPGDVDGDSIVMRLVDGEGDSLNHLFTVDSINFTVRPIEFLDFESQSIVSVRLQLEDELGATKDSVFLFDVIDRNDPADNIRLDSYVVNEYTVASETFAQILFDDVDEDSRSNYQFRPGELNGETLDNNKVRINLRTGEVTSTALLDYESLTDGKIQIRVVIEDNYTNISGSSLGIQNTFSELLEIEVVNVNERPTNLTLSNQFIDENLPAGTVVGILSATDPDGETNLTYSVAGDEDFSVEGNTLITTKPLDFENISSYLLRINVSDSSGLTNGKFFTIGVNNVIVELTFSSSTGSDGFDENLSSGTSLGSFTGASSYRIIEDNSEYPDFSTVSINNSGSLTTTSPLNHEEQDTIRVLIEGTSNNMSATFPLKLAVYDVNEAPTSITVSNNEIIENLAEGTLIGELSATDEDESDETFTYTVAEVADFQISGNQLLNTRSFDFGTEKTLVATVTVSDDEGATYDQEFTITILNDPSDDEEEVVLGVQKYNFSIYPIPSRDFITVTFEGHEYATIEIMDLTGQLIEKIEAYQSGKQLDISELSEGVYFISLITGGKTAKEKFIKH